TGILSWWSCRLARVPKRLAGLAGGIACPTTTNTRFVLVAQAVSPASRNYFTASPREGEVRRALRLLCHDAQPAVIGQPLAVAPKPGPRELFHQTQKLSVLFGPKRFAETQAEHPEPGIQALRSALKRSFAVEERGVNYLQAAPF